MRVKRLLLIAALITYMSSACKTTIPEPSFPIDESVLHISSVDIYEKLNLSENEDIIILDVHNNILLLNVYTDYLSTDEVHYREDGYNSQTIRLVLYDYITQETLLSLSIPQNRYCADGFLWDENSFVYTIVYSDLTQSHSQYDIVYYDGTREVDIASGSCQMSGYEDPHIIPLGDSYFAYSYFDFESKQFGVNIVSKEGAITPQLTLFDNGSTEHLSTKLVSNGKMYLYYAAVNGVGTIFVGKPEEICTSFSLPTTERVYEYCFLTDDLLLFTMEMADNNGNSTTNIVIKDVNGKNLFLQRSNVLFRIESNGNGTALGIDGNYNPYFIQANSSNVQTCSISEVSVAPMRFYAIDSATYLAHTYKSIYLKNSFPSVDLITITS